ncbi:type I restriction endonuclease subunit R [Fibrella aquatica]|uniref:type I restriction endonuclease subunit R n=1 Tax=Fibrella aquatica TaxID=3242487 RepID=UPI00351FE5CA
METPSLRENDASKIPALHLLVQMGYVPLTPTQALTARGGRSSAVLLEDILLAQLQRINSISYRGRDYAFSDTNLNAALLALRDLPVQDGFTAATKTVYDLITLGKSFEQVIEGDRKSYSLRYVDWEHPENNVYHVVPEFSVLRTQRSDAYRPDLVLFVNGIPMGVIECKSSAIKKNPVQQAIRQQLDYQKSDGIRTLYHYSNLLLALGVNEARYGTTNTPEEFWSAWREQTADDVRKADENRLSQLVNSLVAVEREATVLACMNESSQQVYRDLRREPVSVTEQDRLLYSLCRPERLLDLVFNYILFDDNVKKIARYQQYFTIGQTLRRVSRIDEATGRRMGGVIWHTQGSGKSLTMVMLAQMLARHPDIPNPKILLVTDRVDLDDQLTETFRKCKRDVVQATTGASEKIRKKLAGVEEEETNETDKQKNKKPVRDTSLLALLHEQSDDIVTTVVNKFDTALKSSAEPIATPNLFILVDEAHRTQYGNFHVSMRRLFPNACFIAFTGTPLMKAEKNTAAQFGGLIEPAYTIIDAVTDGAVVPLLYEGRHHQLSLNQSAMNRDFNRVAEPLSEYGQAKLKQKYSGLKTLNEADQVIYERAHDIVTHYINNFQLMSLKGQIVVSKKWQAVKYKKYIDLIGSTDEAKRVTCEVVISPPDVREGDDDEEDGYDGDVRAFWKRQMDKYGNPERYEKTIINAFKKHEVPELIIVVRKLTTGFDAPRNSVLYLISSLKEHELLQTVARVNRVYPGKDYGLIVDYVGNLGNLDQALNLYAGLKEFDVKDLDGALNSIDTEVSKLPQAHADVWAIFSEIRNKRDQKAYEELLFDDEKRDDFSKKVSLMARLLKLALSSIAFVDNTPVQEVETYKNDAKFFLDLRASVKHRYSDEPDYAAYEPQIRKLIDKHISVEGDTLVVNPMFALLDVEQRQTEVAKLVGKAAQADHIASRTLKAIEVRANDDPALYRQLAELIQETIDAYHAQRLSEGDYLRRALELEEAFNKGRLEGTPNSLQENPVAGAFHGLAKTLFTRIDNRPVDDALVHLALGIDEQIRSAIMENGRPFVDWQNNLDLGGRIRIDLDDYIYEQTTGLATALPLDLVDQLIEGCLAIAKQRYV